MCGFILFRYPVIYVGFKPTRKPPFVGPPKTTHPYMHKLALLKQAAQDFPFASGISLVRCENGELSAPVSEKVDTQPDVL